MYEVRDKIAKYVSDRENFQDFISICGIHTDKQERGSVVLSMPIGRTVSNIYGIAHGGALFTLMDTCMGLTCLTLNEIIVTLNMNSNFIKGIKVGDTAYATSYLQHHGKTTIVMACEVRNSAGELVCNATGTFFITDKE